MTNCPVPSQAWKNTYDKCLDFKRCFGKSVIAGDNVSIALNPEGDYVVSANPVDIYVDKADIQELSGVFYLVIGDNDAGTPDIQVDMTPVINAIPQTTSSLTPQFTDTNTAFKIGSHDPGNGTPVVDILIPNYPVFNENVTTITPNNISTPDYGNDIFTYSYLNENGDTVNINPTILINDEDNRSLGIDHNGITLGRTLHIASPSHTTGEIDVSHADSDGISISNITTTHTVVGIGVTNSTVIGVNSGAYSSNLANIQSQRSVVLGGFDVSLLDNDSAAVGTRETIVDGFTSGAYSGDRHNVIGVGSVALGGRGANINASRAGILLGQNNDILSGTNSTIIGSQNSSLDASTSTIIATDNGSITGTNSGLVATTNSNITSITSFGGGILRVNLNGSRTGSIASEDTVLNGAVSFAAADRNSFIQSTGGSSAVIATRENDISGGGANFIGGAGVSTIVGRDNGLVGVLRGSIIGNENFGGGGEDHIWLSSRSAMLGGQHLTSDDMNQLISGRFNKTYGIGNGSEGAYILGDGTGIGSESNAHVLFNNGIHQFKNNTGGAPTTPPVDPSMFAIYGGSDVVYIWKPGAAAWTPLV